MYDPLTRMFRALGNHRRRLCLELIYEAAREKGGRGERPFATVTEISRRLKIAQPAVSQYLDKLVAVKLIEMKRVGAAHLCIPVEESAARLRDWFADLLKS